MSTTRQTGEFKFSLRLIGFSRTKKKRKRRKMGKQNESFFSSQETLSFLPFLPFHFAKLGKKTFSDGDGGDGDDTISIFSYSRTQRFRIKIIEFSVRFPLSIQAISRYSPSLGSFSLPPSLHYFPSSNLFSFAGKTSRFN